jgi:hypothetical protein
LGRELAIAGRDQNGGLRVSPCIFEQNRASLPSSFRQIEVAKLIQESPRPPFQLRKVVENALRQRDLIAERMDQLQGRRPLAMAEIIVSK